MVDVIIRIRGKLQFCKYNQITTVFLNDILFPQSPNYSKLGKERTNTNITVWLLCWKHSTSNETQSPVLLHLSL